ncbi:uncharacterized protein LOC115783278 [Archocentrus centrarchus]|uniref:uncharacterized protein LOC115783278 n=1 Tax=Archocentrus centrarchus TaxID=63155 RepID=UPI0011EA2EAF|nr:uncharacterized protein LOC115783278 [Archocentrus centrarchus]
MNIHGLFFSCCFFSVLCNGEPARAETVIQAEGGSVTVECSFSFSGRTKFLCKDKCEDVLIETEASTAQRGRYSIRYKEGTFPVSSTVLRVSVTQLAKSDSGRYSCGLKRPFLPDSHQEFELRVTDALKSFPETVKQVEPQRTDEAAQGLEFKGHLLPLIVCVVVLFAAVMLLFYKWMRIKNPDGLTTRKLSVSRDISRNMEVN